MTLTLSKAILIQACRYELQMRPKHIAPLLGVSPRYVSQVAPGPKCFSAADTLCWEDRPDEQREAAIEAARRLAIPDGVPANSC
jgi:hypothetical protein